MVPSPEWESIDDTLSAREQIGFIKDKDVAAQQTGVETLWTTSPVLDTGAMTFVLIPKFQSQRVGWYFWPSPFVILSFKASCLCHTPYKEGLYVHYRDTPGNRLDHVTSLNPHFVQTVSPNLLFRKAISYKGPRTLLSVLFHPSSSSSILSPSIIFPNLPTYSFSSFSTLPISPWLTTVFLLLSLVLFQPVSITLPFLLITKGIEGHLSSSYWLSPFL